MHQQTHLASRYDLTHPGHTSWPAPKLLVLEHILKFNPHHDPANGRFTSGSRSRSRPKVAPKTGTRSVTQRAMDMMPRGDRSLPSVETGTSPVSRYAKVFTHHTGSMDSSGTPTKRSTFS